MILSQTFTGSTTPAPARSDRTARWAPPAALLAALAAIYWPLLLPGWTPAGADFLQLFYPQKRYSVQCWSTGHVPFWNPYSFLGSPFLASMQPAALYPPDLLLMVLRSRLLWAMKLQVFLHLLWLSGGVYWLLRRGLGGERWGAAIGALAVGAGAFMRYHVEHINQAAALSWAPWIAGAVWMGVGRGRRGALLAVPALAAMQLLAGHPQHAYNTALVTLAMGAAGVIIGPHRRRQTVTALLVAGAWAGGALLAAPQLLPALELVRLSPRAGFHAADALAFSLPPERLLSFVHPRQNLTPDNALSYTNLYGEYGCYVGLMPLLLAVAGAGAAISMGPARRRGAGRSGSTLDAWDGGASEAGGTPAAQGAGDRTAGGLHPDAWRWRWFFLLGAGLTVLFALGGHTPVYRLAAALLPGAGGFRAPARWLFFTALFIAAVGQFGWAVVVNRAVCHRGALRIFSRPGWIGLLSFLLVTADLQVALPPGPLDRQIPQRLTQGAAGWEFLISLIERDGYARLYRFERDDGDHYLNNSPEGVQARRLRLQPEEHLAAGIPLLWGYEQGLLPARAHLALKAKFNRNLRWRDPDAALLALLGVRWIMSDFPLNGANWRPLPAGAAVRGALGGAPMRFYENRLWRGAVFPETTPGAPIRWEAFDWPGDGPLPELGRWIQLDYNPRGIPLFSRDDPATASATIVLRALPGGRYEGTIRRKGQGRGDTRAETLIWSQTALPGWRVEWMEQGRRRSVPAEILSPVHLRFSTPGSVDFVLTYTPPGFHTGLCAATIMLIFYLVLSGRIVRVYIRRVSPGDRVGRRRSLANETTPVRSK